MLTKLQRICPKEDSRVLEYLLFNQKSADQFQARRDQFDWHQTLNTHPNILDALSQEVQNSAITLQAPYPQTNGRFSAAVAIGDVNNDGYQDVIVGAQYTDVISSEDAGKAFVYFGQIC